MTKAIRFYETGSPDVLRWEDFDPGMPGPGEIRMRTSAVGLNFIDTYQRSGLYPVPLPSGLGMEGAGTIVALGEGVTGLHVGQRIAYPSSPLGAYAEERLLPAKSAVPLPDHIDDRMAAAIMLKGMTAEALLRRVFRVKAGDTILWHAAAGGVGLIACQWARHLGVNVIGTVGSDDKMQLARDHGCAHVINYSREDFVARVRDITDGKGVAVVYDSVGKATWPQSLDCIQPGGTMVSFGNASGVIPAFDPLELSRHGSLYLTRPTLFDYVATTEELDASAAALFEVIASGRVKIGINRRFPLAQAAEAHRALEASETTGSTLLIP